MRLHQWAIYLLGSGSLLVAGLFFQKGIGAQGNENRAVVPVVMEGRLGLLAPAGSRRTPIVAAV
jgi:hypothetical protein